MESLYVDLLIDNDGDLAVDSGLEPLLVDNRESIAQDIKHLIMESGLMIELIGDRNPVNRIYSIQKLVRLIEEDDRLIAGTIVITEVSLGVYAITADTVDFGSIDLTINL